MSSRELGRELTHGMRPQPGNALIQWGVVVSIQTGPPHTLTITLGGSATNIAKVSYLASYTPTNGDVIALLVVGSDLIALGKLAT